MAKQQRGSWTPLSLAFVATLAAAAVVLAVRADVLPVDAWGLPIFAAICAGLTFVITMAQGGWFRTHASRAVAWLYAGSWLCWAALAGWTQWVWLGLFGVFGLVALAGFCATPEQPRPTDDDGAGGTDRRPPKVRAYEALLRHLAKAPVTVTDVVPWDRPADGERVYVDLPDAGGMEFADLSPLCGRIQSALKLPPGCVVRVLEGEHQGTVVFDVMLRDSLGDHHAVAADDFTEASVNDPFTVMSTPRGEQLDICLREQSMVIGGTVGSGKTTLLHRIILWLARCSDVLIWIVDLNGGGVAEPWVSPWARGEAERPVVDWVADNEAEAALLVAVAAAIAKDRKTSKEAVRRRRAAKSFILPVDKDLPAIVVIADEGGEVRQAVSVFGRVAAAGISRLAQIGRAEAVRVVMSVLRGTSDLLDKGLRAQAAIRLCLRMQEEGEYGHILGMEPGRTRLIHTGSAYLLRTIDHRPIFGRTVDVYLDTIEQAAIVCAEYRPDLDDRGEWVAARVHPDDVLGREATPEELAHPVMQEALAGRAYSGRWDRFAPKLAEMRGEDPPEPPQDEPVPAPPTGPPPPPSAPAANHAHTPAIQALLAAAGMASGPATAPARAVVNVDDKDAVDREAQRMLAACDWSAPADPAPAPPSGEAKLSARQHVLAILDEQYPTALTSSQITIEMEKRGVTVARTYLLGLLKDMREQGQIAQAGAAYSAVKG